MKKYISFLGFVFFVCAFFSGCMSFPREQREVFVSRTVVPVEAQTSESEPVEIPREETIEQTFSIDDIKNIIWQLTEIRQGYGSIFLNRSLMAANQLDEFFTIQFVNEGINGRASPNRYFATYSLIDENNIMIRAIAGTRMEAFVDIGVLDEQKYYALIQAMRRWSFGGGVLKIYSQGVKEGDEVVLSFKSE